MLRFLWGLIKIICAFFCFVFVIGYGFGGRDIFEYSMAIFFLILGISFHWRFWVLAIPAFFIGSMIGRR